MNDTHHVGMKITVHPTKHVEVELHHMPPHDGQPSPQPGASMPGGAAAVQGEGMVADPMADGMKGAMDAAFSSEKAPIQKPDATRGGNEAPQKKAKPADKSAGTKFKGHKTEAKGAKKAPKGGAAKKSPENDHEE